jgi:hypothetical protein
MGQPELCTLQLSPLYHREEGSEKRGRNAEKKIYGGCVMGYVCSMVWSVWGRGGMRYVSTV